MSRQQGYTAASSIKVLEGLEAVRKRPGMYIGSTDSRGLQHLVWEVVDNAVDEALAGHASRIEVVLHDDGSVEVSDDGRGIPVDREERTGLPGVVVVLTKLHAGGKFGGEGSSYKVSGGLHGVGASVVNALSRRVDVRVDRDGRRHHISFRRGEPGHFSDDGEQFEPGDEPAVGEETDATGTVVRFWPDYELFTDDAAMDLERLSDRARQTAFLVPGLEITVTDARGEHPHSQQFRFDGGAVDFAEHLSRGEPLTPVISVRGERGYSESVRVEEDGQQVTREVTRTMEVDVALRWTNTYEPTVRSFVNIVATPKGGTHVTGFQRALTRVVNEQLAQQRILRKDEDNVTGDDVQEGLVAVVAVRVPEPQFEGQTKEVLGTPAALGVVSDLVASGVREWMASPRNRRDARTALTKVAEAARTRLEAKAAAETRRRKTALSTSSLPAKLADCRSTDVSRTELFIVEGDSAMGTAKQARDSEFQAALPIRGKILNTQRTGVKRMLENKECADIITALGAGTGNEFDSSSLRYGKVVIMADADVDGAHIRTLLLTLFHVHMRPLLEEGRVFAALPPLYGVDLVGGKETLYAETDEELEELLGRLDAEGRRYKQPKRFKGLGEMNVGPLAETTIAPATRRIRRITVADGEEAAAAFERLMGKSVEQRRSFIEARAATVSREKLDV